MAYKVAIIPVPQDKLGEVWSEIEDYAEIVALEDEDYSSEDMHLYCYQKGVVLWVAVVEGKTLGFAITCITERPKHMVGLIRWCGGEHMNIWFPFGIESIKIWFKRNGCKKYDVIGRKGWKKMIPFDKELAYYSENL